MTDFLPSSAKELAHNLPRLDGFPRISERFFSDWVVFLLNLRLRDFWGGVKAVVFPNLALGV